MAVGTASNQSNTTGQQAPALQGDQYGMPTHTNWTEQPDLNSGITTTLATNAVPVTGVVSFRQVDVVRAWRYRQFINNVVVVAGGTINQVSQYAPYSFVGNIQLQINNLYSAIDLPYNGIDLAILNAIRPVRGNTGPDARYTAPTQWPYAVGEANMAARPSAANTSVNPPGAIALPTSAASYLATYDLPVSIHLDEYYDLDPATGTPRAYGEDVEITPLNMGVTARDATPNITMNPVLAGNTDSGPFVETGTNAAFTSGSVTHDFRRLGSYAAAPSEMPPDYGWRYALCARRYALSGVSTATIPLKQVVNQNGGGQILSITGRLYDPLQSNGGGASGGPIALGSISATALNFTLTRAQLIYGSNFVRFDDDPITLQQRFYDVHHLNLPIGVFCWDLCEQFNGHRSNAGIINLMTTDATINLTFNSALSASAYIVVLTESLVYVSTPLNGVAGSR